jgi:dihydroxyacid dehydratase/phosphogluconate dehydratase
MKKARDRFNPFVSVLALPKGLPHPRPSSLRRGFLFFHTPLNAKAKTMNSQTFPAITIDVNKDDTAFMILYGPLAPQGAIASLGPWRLAPHRAKARVFEDQASALRAIMNRELLTGDILVHKSQDCQNPDETLRSLMDIIGALSAAGSQKIILISDAPTPSQEFLRAHRGLSLITHLTPKAYQGGPLAQVRDNQWIEIDPIARTLCHWGDNQTKILGPANGNKKETVTNRQNAKGPEKRYNSLFFNQ